MVIKQQALLNDAWRLTPSTYAYVMSGGRWIPYRHMMYIHQRIQRALIKGNARIAVSLPPRAGKSEGLSVWLSTWLMDTFPTMRIIMASYASSLATGFSSRVRDEIATNPLARAEISATQAQKDWWETTTGGRFVAAGIGGQITGKGFDVGIIDDPIKNWEEASSIRLMEKHQDWYRSTFYTRCEKNASIILIMTRWGPNDLAGYLEHDDGDEWEIIRMPAICDSADDPLGREIGEALCPERQDEERLARIKEVVGPKVWGGLYQQQPKGDGGNIFDLDTFGAWDRLPVPDRLIQSWDMSFGSKAKTASYVVGQVWLESGSKYYLVDQVRGQWTLPETVAQVRMMAEAYPMTSHTLIEKAANGPAVIQVLGDAIINLVEISPRNYGDKVARASAASVAIDKGNVYLPASNPDWLEDYREELSYFPNYTSDDQVDATSQAINWMEESQSRGVWSVYRDRRKAA